MITQDDIRCEWCQGGYCECYCGAESQAQRETNWTCDGTEYEMLECGQIKPKKELDIINKALSGIELTESEMVVVVSQQMLKEMCIRCLKVLFG